MAEKIEGITRKEYLELDPSLIDYDLKDNVSRFPVENTWNPEDTDDLSFMQSILDEGQDTPVWVRRNGANRFKLIAGFRRFLAIVHANANNLAGKMKQADIPLRVKALVRVANDKEAYMASLRENAKRKGVGAVSEAHQIRFMMTALGMSVDEVATFYGRSAAWVTHKRLPLLELSDAIQRKVEAAIYSTDLAFILADMPEEARAAVLQVAHQDKADEISAKTGEDVDPEATKITTGDVKKAAKKTGATSKNYSMRSADVVTLLDEITANTELTRVARKFAEHFKGMILGTTEREVVVKEFTRAFKDKYGE